METEARLSAKKRADETAITVFAENLRELLLASPLGEKRLLTEATFGWAITAHKAQGSQWENVIVWDDGLGRSEIDRRRWLYTAITRAERGLVLLA